jgi:hypothetical protein
MRICDGFVNNCVRYSCGYILCRRASPLAPTLLSMLTNPSEAEHVQFHTLAQRVVHRLDNGERGQQLNRKVEWNAMNPTNCEDCLRLR